MVETYLMGRCKAYLNTATAAFAPERNTSGTSCYSTSGKILHKGMNCALYLGTAVL